MDTSKDQRPWYKKKRYLIPLGTFAFLITIGLFSQDPSSQQTTNSHNQNGTQVKNDTITIPSYIAPLQVKEEPASNPATPTPSVASPQSSSPNYYINSDGNKIQSPTKSQDGNVPSGATARCRDGTYSFSQHRQGTCSHHGGVAEWLY